MHIPFRLLALALCLLTLGSRADVYITATLDWDKYLRYEGIPLTVRIENDTGHPILMGGTNGTSTFTLDVRNEKGHPIATTEVPLLEETWYIPTDGSDERVFDLLKYNVIRRPDSLRVVARVQPLGGEVIFSSRQSRFDVSNGVEMDAIRVRRKDRSFILKGMNRAQADRLFLQVATAKRERYLVTYELERHLRFYPPEIQKDREGRIHTLHYSTPQRVVHCVFGPEGQSVSRDYYSVDGGPRVYLEEGGEQGMVIPGAKRLSP